MYLENVFCEMDSLEILLQKADKNPQSFTQHEFSKLIVLWKDLLHLDTDMGIDISGDTDDMLQENNHDYDTGGSVSGDRKYGNIHGNVKGGEKHKTGCVNHKPLQLHLVSAVETLLEQSMCSISKEGLEDLMDILVLYFRSNIDPFLRYSAIKTFALSMELLPEKGHVTFRMTTMTSDWLRHFELLLKNDLMDQMIFKSVSETLLEKRVTALIKMVLEGSSNALTVIILEILTKLLSSHKHQDQASTILLTLGKCWQELYNVCLNREYLSCVSGHKQSNQWYYVGRDEEKRGIEKLGVYEHGCEYSDVPQSNVKTEQRRADRIHVAAPEYRHEKKSKTLNKSTKDQRNAGEEDMTSQVTDNDSRLSSKQRCNDGRLNSEESSNDMRLDSELGRQRYKSDRNHSKICEQTNNSDYFLPVKRHKEGYLVMCQFILLWIQAIKRLHHQKEILNKETFLQPIQDMFSLLTPYHFDNLILLKLVLKLLIKVFNYDRLTLASRSLDEIYLVTGKQTLGWIQTTFLQSPVRLIGGFGGEQSVTEADVNPDHVSELYHWRLMANLIIKISAILLTVGDELQGDNSCLQILKHVDECVALETSLADKFMWIAPVFVDQDDMWIETLLSLLDVYIYGRKRCHNEADHTVLQSLQPHRQFILLLQTLDFDHSILVDFLISPETCFLLYLTRYLKLVVSDWHNFLQTLCQISFLSCNGSVKESSSESNAGCCMLKRGLTCCSVLQNHDSKEQSDERPGHCDGQKYDSKLGLRLQTQGECSDSMEHSVTKSYGLNLINDYADDDDDDDDDGDDGGGGKCNKCDEKNTVRGITKMDLSTSLSEVKEQTDVESEGYVSNNLLDKIMATMIRVRIKLEGFISSDVILYNPKPLIELIEKCEEFYDSSSQPLT